MTTENDPAPAPTAYQGTRIKQWITHATMLLRAAEAAVDDVDDLDYEVALDFLAHVKKLRSTAAVLEARATEAAIASMLTNQTPAYQGDGYIAFLRPGGERKGWQHTKTMDTLIDATTTDLAEHYPFIDHAILRNIVEQSMWTVHKSARITWRSTSLRQLGIDPDTLSTKTVDLPTLDLRGIAAEASPRRPTRKATRR